MHSKSVFIKGRIDKRRTHLNNVRETFLELDFTITGDEFIVNGSSSESLNRLDKRVNLLRDQGCTIKHYLVYDTIEHKVVVDERNEFEK
jgi:hypothetical protein